jgi:hypothetical protein
MLEELVDRREVERVEPHARLLLLRAAAVVAPNAMEQQPASAGATRPNLRVLQALPESQLFPLMNRMTRRLGARKHG